MAAKPPLVLLRPTWFGLLRNGAPPAMQVNIDFESEQDMVEKARIGLALQPVATALFANSPFRDGKPTGRPALPAKKLVSLTTGCLDLG